MANVREVRTALRRAGHEPVSVPVHLGDFRWLTRARKADLVFNLCEGINGHARYEDFVVGALELTGVPFTGCRHWPIAVCHRKHVANTLLAAAGVPVPAFTLAQANKIPADFPLPAIVKPTAEDASVGIDRDAVCTTAPGAPEAGRPHARAVRRGAGPGVHRRAASSTSGFVGDRMLPISEIRFDRMPEGSWPIVTYAAKWMRGAPRTWAPSRSARPTRRPTCSAASARWPGMPGLRHGERRGLWPGGPAGGRAGHALRARGESLPRPVERRRPGADGARRGMELRRTRAAGGGGGAHRARRASAAAAAQVPGSIPA